MELSERPEECKTLMGVLGRARAWNVMNDKLHVSMKQHVCLVCGVAFDTGAILLDTLASYLHHSIKPFFTQKWQEHARCW